jgi:hypothetical protein
MQKPWKMLNRYANLLAEQAFQKQAKTRYLAGFGLEKKLKIKLPLQNLRQTMKNIRF